MKKSIVPFLILFFVIALTARPGEPSTTNSINSASPPPSEIPYDSAFQIVPSDKISDSPVHWVTAGGGVLAYGSGRQIHFVLEVYPFEIVSSLSFDQDISQALILGRYAFIGQESSGIRLLDLADPFEPIDLGLYTLPISASHLASFGNLLLVGDGGPLIRLFEIDLSEDQGSPTASQTVFVDRGSIPIGTPVTAITVGADAKAYIASEREVKVYDLSDPSNPVEVDRFSLTVPVRSMAVNGDYLFAAAGAEGLYVIDLSVPEKTVTLTTCGATDGASGESLYVAGRKIYLAGGADGLQLLEVGPTGPATFDVLVGNYGFVPHTVNIHTGDTIRWIWMGPGSLTASGTFHILSSIGSSATKTESLISPHTFDTPGTFQFDCIPSCSSGMAGTVSVVTPLASGDVSITPPSIDFGNVTVGTPSDQTFTIANTSVASVLHGTVGSLSPPFSVVSGGGAFNNVLPGQSVAVTVRFLPAAAGLSSATLTVTHTLGLQSGSTDVPLNGTGVSPINISVTPATINFGSVAIGSSSDQTITITNQSSSTGRLTGSVGTLSAPFSIVSGEGVVSLTPGQSKSVVLRFSPTGLGQSSGTLSITHNAGNQTSPTNVSLSGTGTAATINITINPASVNFGNVNVGQTLDKTITITNQTSSTGTLSGTVGSLSAPFSVVSGGGTFSLNPNQSRSVVVRFSPTTAGPFPGTLSIMHNAGNQASPANVSLSGTGGPAPPATINISISPTSIDFGSGAVGQMFDQTLTITNQSSSTGTLDGSVGTPSAPFSIVSGGGTFSLTPGQSKPVVVRFSPTATGPFSGTLSINHNAGNQTSPANVPLSGTGITPIPGTVNISVTPPSLNFGNVALGHLSDMTVTIANLIGSTGMLIGNVGTLSAPFSIVSGSDGAFSLTPGQSKSVVVRFSPTVLGQFSGTLSITHHAGNQSSPISLPLSGTGVTPVPPAITVIPTFVDFGSVTLGQISDQTITITNQAGATETLTGNVGALSAPFSVVSGGGVFNLPPGQTKSVIVRFLPTTAGTASGSVPVTHNATNQDSPVIVSLTGTGVTPPPAVIMSIIPLSIDFGNVTSGRSLDRTVTIGNSSNSTGDLVGNVTIPPAPFSVVSGEGAFSLAPGQSKTVTVRFSPTQEGAVSGNLSITHNATNQGNPANIPLSGTGIEPGGQNIVISFISGLGTGKPGGKISIETTIANQGMLPANSVTVYFYLSTDTQIDTSDRLIGKRSVRNLAPGASSGPVSTRVTLPRDVAPGSYFIGAIATYNTSFDSKGITICLPLSKPTLLSPQNRGKDISAEPTLDWSNVNGATSYEVHVATDSQFTDGAASMTGLTDTLWTVAPALNSRATYFWRVRAVNACGPGPWSPAWSFKTM